jgi:hypothetical protein
MTLSRRTILQGLGTAIALPWLESLSSIVSAAPLSTGSATANANKVRTIFLYVPNGVNMPDWTPATEGTGFTLPNILEPLKPFQNYINVFSGLTLDKARANGDGPGDHARANAAFLTGRQPRKTNGADIRVGQSADQWIAGKVGEHTKFASLELGIERGLQSGNCDSGYSCAYQANFSWRAEATPNAKEIDPKQVFDRLFGTGTSKEQDEQRLKRDAQNKSILDFVMEDAKSLNDKLGSNDRRKMDEYLTAIREIEARIEKARQVKSTKIEFKPNMTPPTGVPNDRQEHIRLMCDLSVLAFQADLTRVITLPFANDGSNFAYNLIGVGDGHHDLSHHGSDKTKLEKIRKINRFHIEQVAYLLDKLQKAKEGTKSLLDNTMLVYGSGIGDGNRHNHDDLPILLMGGAGGKVKGGRHIRFPKDTPLMNLYLAMFEKLDCPTKSFGDSTGVLSI